jgi:hypothetical protein
MTITEGITGVYLKATGKATPPNVGSAKYNQIVSLMDFYQRRFARENDVDWNSLYDPSFSIGNVTATDSFDLDSSSIRKLSDREGDYVTIMWTDGVGYSDYDIVNHDELKQFYTGQNKENPRGKYCTQIGNSLVFNHKFLTTDPEYGGDIQVPIYAFPDPITATAPDSDEIQVDDPDWLLTRCAAEYVRNDIVRRSRYPELLAEANEIMTRMKSDNEEQVSTIIKPWTPFSGLGGDNAWY